jgi:hypothetical protein
VSILAGKIGGLRVLFTMTLLAGSSRDSSLGLCRDYALFFLPK